MKILNYSYGKITFWKTNSWKSGERHLADCQVSPDISKSLTNKHTHTTQANLFGINTDDASEIWGMTSWMSYLQEYQVVPASLAASRQPRSQGSQSAGGMEDEGEVAVTEKITARIRNSDFRLHGHSRMEELFSRIVSICTLIFMDCILCAWSCAKF